MFAIVALVNFYLICFLCFFETDKNVLIQLQEKHMLEFQQYQEKIRKELRARMKFSRDLLELRDKEAKLVRVKRYEEAEKIKMKADLLEEFERNKLEAEMQAVLQKKEAKLRHQ